MDMNEDDPIFVIQAHDTGRLHYDLRLEIDGVLKSWSVPKGPSTDPRVKRLAIPTEDHPLEYATFEGVIPESEYGAGTVQVWDTGTYRNLKEIHEARVPMSQMLGRGELLFHLDGKKLHGGFALIKIKKADNVWLMVKMRDEFATARSKPINGRSKSALTGRTLDEIREGKAPSEAKR